MFSAMSVFRLFRNGAMSGRLSARVGSCVLGTGLRSGLGLGFPGLGFGVVSVFGFRIQDFGFKVWYMVVVWVSGFGSRFWGLGLGFGV